MCGGNRRQGCGATEGEQGDYQSAGDVAVASSMNGMMVASVQALYQMIREKDAEIQQLRAQMTQQQAQLNQVKRLIRRKRTVRK